MDWSAKSIIPKVAALGSLGFIGYTAISNGLDFGKRAAVNDFAHTASDVFVSHQTSSAPSAITEKLKSMFRGWLLSQNILSGALTVKNIAKSTVEQLTSFSPWIALSLAALLAPPPVSVASASLLGLGAGKILFGDVLGIMGSKNRH